MNFAFLFDIDGCLTLPGYSTSILDVDLIDAISKLSIDRSIPVAFVTGRSDGWLRKQYNSIGKEQYLQIPTYIEFGLAFVKDGTVGFQQASEEFLETRLEFIEAVANVCDHQGVYFETEQWYDDYPDHGSLWIENKHIQLSIAGNRDFSTKELHMLVDIAWNDMYDQARILHHHLGVDVVPTNWSKAMATKHFIQTLDEENYQWYVFGDNQSDKEMIKGLSNCDFVETKKGASYTVRQKLLALNIDNFKIRSI